MSRSSLGGKINALAVELHKRYENANYDSQTNGEFTVLRKLAKAQGSIRAILDVGANKGDWSIVASEIFPQATIHAFEIVPQTFDRLVENCRHHRNIVCHSSGLSDKEGTTTVFFSPDHSELATCVPDFTEKFHKLEAQKIDATVLTGEKFCADQGIESIDFLKVDVEGYEHKVLKGFEEMLKRGRIKLIQFEYGYVNIETHFLLKDFYEYLNTFDMKIGKIYPSYVEWREYRYDNEDFYGPNYLSVHSSCQEIENALGSQ
jgi:FkbM family methyltransferase